MRIDARGPDAPVTSNWSQFFCTRFVSCDANHFSWQLTFKVESPVRRKSWAGSAAKPAVHEGLVAGSPTRAFAASMLVGVAAQDLLIAVSLRIINTPPFLSDFIPFLGW